MDDILSAELFEPGQQVNGAARRIAGCRSQAQAFVVGLELLVLAVTGLPKRKRYLRELSECIEADFVKLRLDLHAFNSVEMVDVFDLVAEDEGEFVLACHLIHKAEANKDMASGQGEGVDQIGIWIEVEPVWQAAVSICRDACADLTDIVLQGAE